MAALLDIVKKGSTDRSVTIRIIDATTGAPETGVVYDTSGIDLWYRREGAAKTAITEAALSTPALNDAHADGGFLHIGDGEYRLDLPDAAFATGANYFDVGGAVTGMIVIGGRVRLVDFDLETATQKVDLDTIKTKAVTCAAAVTVNPQVGQDYKIGVESDGDLTKVNTLDGHTAQTGDSYPIVSHADYGNAKLVRSATPANTLNVDSDHKIAVPDTQNVNVHTWLTNTPAALTDTDKLQVSIQHIAASYDYTATHVWYVSKAGDDSNGGHAWGDARLTIASALSSAVAGDTILLGPGAYSESIDASAKAGLWIEGAGIGAQITYDGLVLKPGSQTTIKGIRLTCSGTSASNIACNASGTSNVRIVDCLVEGKYDGIQAGTSTGLQVINTRITATYDAINLSGATEWILRDSVFYTDCTYSPNTGFFRAAYIYGSDTKVCVGHAHNCIFVGDRNDTTAGDVAAVSLGGHTKNYIGQFTFDNCNLHAIQRGAGSGDVAGVCGEHIFNAAIKGSWANAEFNGGKIEVSNAGTGSTWSIYQDTGTIAIAPNVRYDKTKTSGTITLTGFDSSSDTVILASSQPSYAPAVAGDEMTLTAAYDLAKTAASSTELTAVQTHGDSNWATATGFSTHSASDVASAILTTPANKLATGSAGEVTTDTASREASKATGFSTFNAASDTVTIANIDGISSEVALAAILAGAGGKTVVDGNTIEFKRRDGLTTVLTVGLGTTAGERTSSVLEGE